jgi:arylsulfatase A-like enzyme
MDPHAPYSPPEPYRTQFAPNWREMPDWQPRWRWPDEALPFLSDLYDGEIAYNDASFGSLVADLERRGLYDDLALVFVSDHGEEFREHGRWRHGNNLHRETLAMPLVVKLPGQHEGRRVAATVQQIDLMPTLLELAGAAPPPGMQGRSLVALAKGRSGAPADPPAHSHLLLGRVPEQLALVAGDWKLLYAPASDGPGTRQLYRWRDDPGEQRDLAAELPVRTAVLTALLHRRWTEKGHGAAAEVELDAELQKTLRSLGYLQ